MSYFASAIICLLDQLRMPDADREEFSLVLVCVRGGGGGGGGGGGASLPSGFLWICLNMLLYQSLGLFTLWYKKRRQDAEGKQLWGMRL